jgi:sulfur relay (sulfurtransferase) DsrC/TusE family protein
MRVSLLYNEVEVSHFKGNSKWIYRLSPKQNTTNLVYKERNWIHICKFLKDFYIKVALSCVFNADVKRMGVEWLN